MFSKICALALWVSGIALTVMAHFGYRCPAPGCPGCKLVGK